MLLGVDFGPGAPRAVVAEHADEGRGALRVRQGDAGPHEGGEDVGVEGQRVGDGGHDPLHEGAGEVPRGLELVSQRRGTVSRGLDRHDALLVWDLRVAFLAGCGAACGLVVCLFGGVGGQVEIFRSLGEEAGVGFYHVGMVCEG